MYVHEPRHRRFHITALAGSSPEIPLHRPSLHATSRISAIRKTNMFDGAGQRALPMGPQSADRKSDVSGKSVSVRVDLGGRRIITKQTRNKRRYINNYNKKQTNITSRYM